MKIVIFIFILSVSFIFKSLAQSDTLVIKLKNGQVDKIALSQIQKMKFENVTGVEDKQVQIKGLEVIGNHPNPFTELTNIDFEIANAGAVKIVIYDNNGKQIQTLECNDCQAGKNTLQWNGLDKNSNKVQNGVYYYEAYFGKETQAKKMIVIGGGK